VTVTLGPVTFDHVVYDDDRDVLYLAVGAPQAAADSLVTPEGHVLRYADSGELIGVTLINAKWLFERDGYVNVTPPRLEIAADQLAPAFA
jgi:uncharacterized protein YuzE